MPYYRRVGEIPRKRHARFPQPGGGLYAEELMGEDGFSSSSSLLYHRHSPTAITAAEAVDDPDPGLCTEGPLLPRHFRTHALATGGDAVRGRRLLLANDDVRVLYAAADRPSELYRNATGDELLYVEEGDAVLESAFGSLDVAAGDYVVIPTATTHRLLPRAGEFRVLIIEASGHVHPPRRYLSREASSLSRPRIPSATSGRPRGRCWSRGAQRPCSCATGTA